MGLLQNVERTDISELILKEDAYTDQDGFLHARIALAKPGIYPYILDDGTIRREFKPSEELLSEETVKSVNWRPVTDMHPGHLVTSERCWATCGLAHGDAKVEGDKIIVSETIFDGDLVRDVISGAKAQVSGGFRCDIDMTPGEWNGEPYDAIQRNIRFNHIAHVPQGRCGPECAVLLDAADARGYRMDAQDPRIPRTAFGIRRDAYVQQPTVNEGGNAIMKIKIGDKEHEVTQEVYDHIQNLETQNSTLTQERDTLKGTIDSKNDALTVLQGKVETLTGKVDSIQNVNIDEAVTRRLELVDTVRRFCGDSVDVKGKTEQELQVTVIQALNKDFKADGKSAEYIKARFDAAIEVLAQIEADAGAPVGNRQLQFGRRDGGADKLADAKAARLNIRKA